MIEALNFQNEPVDFIGDCELSWSIGSARAQVTPAALIMEALAFYDIHEHEILPPTTLREFKWLPCGAASCVLALFFTVNVFYDTVRRHRPRGRSTMRTARGACSDQTEQ